MSAARKWTETGGSLAGFLVVLCIAIAVNVILSNFSARLDLTEEHLYQLSGGTKSVLNDLKAKVTLSFFFNGSDQRVPMALKNYAQRVEDLLREYELAGKGKIAVVQYDPKPDSDAEEWAQKYGISGQALGLGGPLVYMGLVASQGDAEAVLPFLDPRAENLLEYNLTRMITRITNAKKPVVGVVSTMPVMGGRRMPYMMPNQPEPKPAWFAFQELREDYEVRELDLSSGVVDGDVDAIVVVHPKDLPDLSLYALDQFVLRGGRLLMFLDALCLAEAENQMFPNMQNRFGPKSSNPKKLLDAWGVTFETSKVVADLEGISRLRTPDNRIEESPAWLSLRRTHMNEKDTLTAQIETMMMPYAGAFTVQPGKDVQVTSLLSSSQSSGLVDAMMAQFSVEAVRKNFKSGMKRMDLAVRLNGKFKTAFPEGKPKEEKPDAEGEKPKEAARPADGLAESAKPTTVILVGDVDMIYDQFCVQMMNFLGFRAPQPMNDNITFFQNAVDQVAGSTALASVRTRGKTDRPFELVMGLQRAAQMRYMEEETRLQQKLEDARQKLNELQSRKDKNQRAFLSAQQREEIENFKKEVARTNEQLRIVRRNAREDIEKLGVKVKAVNIVLVPALVLLGGVGFWGYRRVKTRR